MLRSPGMPPTANIETWLRDVEAKEGLFRVTQIEWLGKPWDVDGLKANKKRTLSQMRSLNVYKSKGVKMLAESLESAMSGLRFAHS